MFPMTACDLSVKVRQKHIIGPINLTINEGGITVLVGPNGAGKTTLLKALHGIIRLANGQVTFATPAKTCLLYTSPSPRDLSTSRMPSSA